MTSAVALDTGAVAAPTKIMSFAPGTTCNGEVRTPSSDKARGKL